MDIKPLIKACDEPIVVYDIQGRAVFINPSFEKVFGWQANEILGKKIDFVPEDEFLSKVSHEIQIPMNHIKGMTQLLLNTCLDNEQQEFVESLEKSADDLLAVVSQMLDYSRIGSGRAVCKTIDFDLRTMVEKIKDTIILKAGEKGLKFKVKVHQSVPSLLTGDPGLLRQILLSLCTNSVKFTDQGGVFLDIFLEQEDDNTATIGFEVKTTGIDIVSGQTGFDILSQKGDFASPGRTGLGLIISKRLVQMMGTAIDVENTRDNGFCYKFILTFDKQCRDQQGKILITRQIQGKNILVVDNNPTERRVLKILIQEWDCFHWEAVFPEQALDMLDETSDRFPVFDIILLNMEMPGGEELAEKIKTRPSIAHSIVIMLAPMGKPGDVDRLRKIRINGYLSKPFSPSELYECIAAALATAAKTDSPNQVVTRHTLAEYKKQQVHIIFNGSNRINQKIIRNIFDKSGYQADAAENLDKAFEAFKTGAYNIMLMDLAGSGANGLDMARKIRQFEKDGNKKRIPIIALADTFVEDFIKDQLTQYVDDFFAKPFTSQGLLKIVEKWTWKNEGFLRVNIDGYLRMKSQKNRDIIFNIKPSLERAMDDKVFLEMLANEFVEAIPQKIERIRQAALKKDLKSLILTAHSLKGSSATIGADRISQIASKIEKMGETGDLGQADKRIKQLENESDRFKEYLSHMNWNEI